MDKDRAAAIAAIATRGEQIKTNSAEYLWICRGVKPALPPQDKPAVVVRNSSGPEVFENATRRDSEQLQLRARAKLR
jgi:hypothetical protein